MPHRISIFNNFVSNEDCELGSNLLMEFDKKNLLKTRTHGNVDSSKDDNVNVKMAPYTQDTISLIKKIF